MSGSIRARKVNIEDAGRNPEENMRMIPTTLLTTILMLGIVAVQAQQDAPFHCQADDLSLIKPLDSFSVEELARIATDEAELEAFTQDFVANWAPGARNPYVITVVFHIIHDNGPENISNAQVEDAMRVLNEDFNKLNPDWPNVKAEFLGIVADVGVEFRLAKKDPQGNCTNGITRTQSVLTYEGDQTMKNLIQWRRDRYLNVWVAASAGGPNTLGYTYRPNSVNNNASWDGIVMVHTATGAIGTSSPSRSRALTHEVGHWINLAHTWGNSNTPLDPDNCNGDDGVADTPNTIGTQNCNLNSSTCNSLDNVENYMDYSFCFKMFTEGQKARMLAALNATTAQRSNLWQASTLALTGVNDEPQICAAVFGSDQQVICGGNSVTFHDMSFHGVQSRIWSFPGGTPDNSTAENPTVTYTMAGTYPVTLTVSDGINSVSSTVQNSITVLANPGVATPMVEGFEDYADLGGSPFTVVNPNNNATWNLTSTVAYSGTKSLRILNNSSMEGQSDELISGTYDLADANGITLGFRYAYAQRNSANDDRLRIWVSNNCGETWSLRQQLRGINTLNTGGVVSGTFVPNGPDQWGFSEITNISATYEISDMRFKFEFESDGGNNVYLDDININGQPVGLEEIMAEPDALQVVPNPAEHSAQAVFSLERTARVRVELLDVLGRHLRLMHEGELAAGEHRMDLPVTSMESGMYFVRLIQESSQVVERFVVK